MKRFIVYILIASFIFMMSMPFACAAGNSITVSATVDNTTKLVTITGTVSAGQGKEVTVYVLNPSNGTDFIGQTTSEANGAYAFSYTLDEDAGGTYKVYVGGAGVSTAVQTEFVYEPATAEDPVTEDPETEDPETEDPVTEDPADEDPVTENPVTESPVTENPATPLPSDAPEPVLNQETGEVKAQVDSKALDTAFKDAVTDENGVKTVSVEIKKIEGAKAYTSVLPASVLTSADSTKKVEIKTEYGAVTLPSNMLSNINIENAEEVGLTIAKADTTKLPEDVKSQIGDRPVIELNLNVDGKVISYDNPEAPVTVAIPYTPSKEELKNPEHIVVWYIDSNGNIISVPNGKYDAATGCVVFTTTHFSTYAIVYVNKTFSDIGLYPWANKEIRVLAAKGIMEGVSDTEFNPGESISRAYFVSLLVRAFGLNAKFDTNFHDVKPEDDYYEPLGIARKLGIAKGVGNDLFKPDENLSRQDMMVLIARTLTIAKNVPVEGSVEDLKKFSDASEVSEYALNEVAFLVKEGIIVDSGSRIKAKDSISRARTAVILYRLINKW